MEKRICAEVEARRYRNLVVLAGACLLWGTLGHFGSLALGPVLVLLAALAVLSERYPLELPGYGIVSGVEIPVLTALFLGQPEAAAALLALGVATRAYRRGREARLEFTVYTLAQMGLCYFTPYLLVTFFAPGAHLVALVAGAVLAAVLDQLCAAFHLYLLQSRIGRPQSRMEWAKVRLAVCVMLPVALLLSASIVQGAVVTGLLMLPLTVAFRGIRSYVATLREARDVVASLVEAAERREVGSQGHAERVAQWSGYIARELGMREREVRWVVNAGRLHDLGKIGIDEAILNKSGALSEEDFASLRRHPEVGAKVAAHLSLGQVESEYIRHHHERYDGGGYPSGLSGHAIPQGARILAVAEAYDSMLHNAHRPRRLTTGEALAEITAGRGSQFDPVIVEAFETVLRKKSA